MKARNFTLKARELTVQVGNVTVKGINCLKRQGISV